MAGPAFKTSNRKHRRAADKLERQGRSEDAEASLDRRGLDLIPLLLTDREAAIWLGLSRATFWRRVADGTFPAALKIGGSTRWRRDELVAALERISADQREPGA